MDKELKKNIEQKLDELIKIRFDSEKVKEGVYQFLMCCMLFSEETADFIVNMEAIAEKKYGIKNKKDMYKIIDALENEININRDTINGNL